MQKTIELAASQEVFAVQSTKRANGGTSCAFSTQQTGVCWDTLLLAHPVRNMRLVHPFYELYKLSSVMI
ncbi:hypothetical protein Pan54_36540 [Rubinisphaera italica]|uniref:Uncharacterized protein n=1 Tax=Rubinisphaera italica TaxID=2527969 RepID=A0A5C5XKJ6_9PLAN|nr:hypothetical protein Pan54_36540 [Rubinisphaera italica]